MLPEERQRSAAIKIQQVRPAAARKSGRKKKGGKGPEADLLCNDCFLPGFIHRGRVGDRGGRFPVGSCLGLCTKASGKAQMSIDTFVYQWNIQCYFFCFFPAAFRAQCAPSSAASAHFATAVNSSVVWPAAKGEASANSGSVISPQTSDFCFLAAPHARKGVVILKMFADESSRPSCLVTFPAAGVCVGEET